MTTAVVPQRQVQVSDLPPLRTKTPADRWGPLILGTLSAVIMLINLYRWPRFEDDEGTYIGQADAVFHGALAPYTYTYDHPFFAWATMAPFYEVAQWFGLHGTSAIFAGRLVMVLCGAAVAALIFKIARRMDLPVWLAAAGSLIWMTSGLVHDDARAVYLDNVAIVWVLVAFYLALSPRQHMWHYLAAGASFGMAVISKETTAIFGPAILLAMWNSSWRRLRGMHFVTFFTASILIGLIYPLYALLKTEFWFSDHKSSLLGMLQWQFGGREGSGHSWDWDSARNQVITDWLYYDKWLIIAGVVAGILCLFTRRTRPVGLAVVLGSVPVFLMSGYLPSMYHLTLDPFFALAIVAVASWVAVPALAALRSVKVARKRPIVTLVTVPLALALTVGVGLAMPVRAERMDQALTENGVGQFYEARAWALANIPVGERVVTNGEVWNDFIKAGWTVNEVLPYTKLDRDPTFSKFTPQWIVMTPTLKRDGTQDTQATRYHQFLERAVPVATFGDYAVLRVS